MLNHQTEARLRQIIAAAVLIRPDSIGPDDDLSRSGVDSLSMLRVIADVEAEFDIVIPDERFVSIRTLRSLTAAVEARVFAGAA
jgi:acyl carrier protein